MKHVLAPERDVEWQNRTLHRSEVQVLTVAVVLHLGRTFASGTTLADSTGQLRVGVLEFLQSAFEQAW